MVFLLVFAFFPPGFLLDFCWFLLNCVFVSMILVVFEPCELVALQVPHADSC